MIKRRNNPAFTLIELLVVVAIIAILITLLVPSISRAIAKAQRVKCANNMHNLGQAWASYASEHNGQVPGSETTGSVDWVVCLHDWNWNKEKKREGIKQGTLWDYVEDLSTYRCPGTYGFMKEYLRNYSFVATINGKGSGGRQRDRIGEIFDPTTRLLMVEDFDWRGFNRGSWKYNGRREKHWYHWVDYLPGNHLGGDNFLFCDGHVEYRRYEDPQTLSVYDPRHFFLPDPDGVNPDMDWIGRRYKSLEWYDIKGRLKEEYRDNPPWN